MGSLSPKLEMHKLIYISLVMLILVATDAIGMGINMDLDQVFF